MKLHRTRPHNTTAIRSLFTLLLFLTQLCWIAGASAQVPPAGTPWQFDITGFLQEATPANPIDPQSGGTLKVNGHLVTVPANTIVILPANALTWQELFSQAPAPYTGVATGMAAADIPEPLAKYEVHVTGNVIPGPTPGTGQYVAGLVSISQQGLNSGQGYVNFIDYAAGELRVGGVIGDPATGTRVRINDPIGKFGRVMTPDRRFTIDEDNPTIRSTTGFPMCLPRVTADPTVAGNPDDPLCPQGNRPKDGTGAFAGSFTMNDPTPVTGLPGVFPDATKQAPFEIGDFVTFSGTLVTDNAAAPTAGPYPGTASTYISAHTITNNIAIYTWPNTNPAYVAIDVTLLGTGGTTVIGATEAATRTRFEGFSTDPSRIVHLYGIDLNCDGSVAANRDWGTIDVDPGPPTGAVKGRWRFRPPSKVLSMPAAGVFLPATREVRAVIEPAPGTTQIAGWTSGSDLLYANGIIAGQYHAPITEYIFPEQIIGSPVPPANFETMPFLANGGYSSSAGTVAGQLSPWPGIPTPASTCQAPAATALATPSAIGSGGTVTLSATSTGTTPITFTWTQVAGTAGTFGSTSGPSVTWTAPSVAGSETATFQVTATNSSGFSTATVNVTVNPPAPPVITSATASNTQVASNGSVGLSATATGAAPISFAWAQTAGPTGAFTPAPPNAASVSWTAPPVSVATNASFTVTATNGAGSVTSGPVTVTINPVGAPTVQPVAAQSVLPGAAVSIPVTATTANSRANLALSAVQTTGFTLTNFNVSGPSQTCTAAGCTATWTVSFTAPTVTASSAVNFTLTTTDTSVTPNLASAPAFTSVTINPIAAPAVNHVTPLTVLSGAAVSMPVTATTADTAANVTLSVTQTTAFTLAGFTVNGPAKACTATQCTFNWTVNFTAPTLPAGQVVPDVINFTIAATDISVTPNQVSAPEFTSVTVNPIPDTIAITSAEYRRAGKQRLIINATSSVVSPNVVLTLQPYVTQTGTTYNPCPPSGVGCTFTNNGGGLYTITLVGAPEPAIPPATPLDVKSNLKGDSGSFALTRIR